jgi:hypothetical protein
MAGRHAPFRDGFEEELESRVCILVPVREGDLEEARVERADPFLFCPAIPPASWAPIVRPWKALWN